MYFQANIHAPAPGLKSPTYNTALKKTSAYLNSLARHDAFKSIPHFKPLFAPPDELISELTLKLDQAFSDVLILGTGGSSLGAQVFNAFADKSPEMARRSLRIHFPDNLSEDSLNILAAMDVSRTHFIVISKSGSTPETLAQLAICLQNVNENVVSSDIQKHFTFVTSCAPSPLRNVAAEWSFPIVEHPDDLSGRFSAFSAVGMLPAAIAGLDLDKIITGARQMLTEIMHSQGPGRTAFSQNIALQYMMYKEHAVRQTVTMCYDNRLICYMRWFAQLWSESLGKDGQGLTPISALGPRDQHSQLQLFLDGPSDKYYTVIYQESPECPTSQTIHHGIFGDKQTAYMNGISINDMVVAEAKATIQSMIEKKRTVRVISAQHFDITNIAALMASAMLETMTMAHLIGVEAFDQPAVNRSKELTSHFLINKQPIKPAH